MNEETQARRLAEWLAAPAGTAPPEDLDPEVLAAVFALRPDLAPAPRLGIDAILATVSSGPFAVPSAIPDPTADALPGFPVAANSPTAPVVPPTIEAAPVVPDELLEDDGPTEEEVRARRASLRVLTPGAAGAPPKPAAPPRVEHEGSSLTTPGARRRIPVWLYPALAVGFAAAASLTLIVPVALQEARKQAFAPPTTTEAEYPMPSAAPTAAREQPVGQELAASPPAAPAGVAEMAPPPPPAPPADLALAADGAGGGGDAALVGGAVTGDANGPVAGAPAVVPTEVLAPEPASAEGEGATIAEAKAPARSTAELAEADDWRAEEPRKERARDEEQADSLSKKASADADLDAVTSRPATTAPAAPAAAAAPSGGRSYQTTSPTSATTGSSALSDRNAAVPLDYDAGWYRAYADVGAAYSLAAQYEAAGNWSAAVEAYRPYWADARLDVAQDSAWRGARAIWAQGRTSEALAIVQNALRRGGGATVFRVHLLVLKGDLLNASGRGSEAARAWAEAAALNRQRSGSYPSTESMPAAAPR